MQFRIRPGSCLQGDVRIPGDKSISHRSIMLGALAEGETRVSGFLEGEDALATVAAMRALGAEIEGPEDGHVVIRGRGLHGFSAPQRTLDLGNSGTSIRLLSGILAAQAFTTTLTGDASLRRRPMRRVTDPLTAMGARIETADGGCPPLIISGAARLKGIEYAMPVASAQVKSALLLAGLYASGRTTVHEPAPTRDHTERMLQGFGYPVERHGRSVMLDGGGVLQGTQIEVPADISSAAFFMVGASIADGSDVLLTHVGMNPTRTGVVNILRLMGADIVVQNERLVGGEPVADLRVRSAPLRGIEIPVEQVPLAIDEFPVLFIAAACAKGRTVLHGAEELRVKESDRIAAMAEGLTTLGIAAEVFPDGIAIEGGVMGGGVIETHMDHRIAMAFSIAGLAAEEEIVIRDCDHVATSFPGFDAMARGLGLQLSAEDGTD